MKHARNLIIPTLIFSGIHFIHAAVDNDSQEMKGLVKAVEKLRDSQGESKLKFRGAESTARAKLKAAQKKNNGPEIDALAVEIESISKKYWGAVESDLNAQRQAGKDGNDFAVLMRGIVDWPKNYWIDCRTEAGRAKAKASRDEFNQKISRASGEGYKGYFDGSAGRGSGDYTKQIDAQVNKILTELPGYGKAVTNAQDSSGYSNYHAMLAWQTYLEGMVRLYPARSQYQTALGKVKAEIASVGSESGFEARWKSNSKGAAAKVRMPPAKNNDPYVIQEVRKAFSNGGFTAEILKIHVLTTGWTMRRNQYTSVIEGRTQDASIATRTSKGECLLYRVTLHQQYDGSQYVNSTFDGFANVEMLCSNVPK